MNFYGIIILLTLISEYLLNLLSNCLNISRLAAELPKEMQGIYDAEAYRKSQNYARESTKFGLLTATLMLIFTLVFWFSEGFNQLDVWVRAWQFSVLPSGLLYIATLYLGLTLLSLPFSIYRTFVIEEKFGFNKTTVKLFCIDLLKGAVLSVLLGGPLLAALLSFFEFAGAEAWFYAWIVTTLFLLLIQLIAPTWIMPLFNTFKPLEEGTLKDKIMALAKTLDFPLQNVFVIDGSKRSSKSNAFFTGFGKNKRIALYDTLIETQTIDELVAILAHEIGHYKKKHVQQGMILSIVHTGVMFFLLSVFLSHQGLYDAFYIAEPATYTGLLFFSMLYSPIEFILSLFLNMLSRKNEYEADRFAVKAVKGAETMVTALKKLAAHNLSNLSPHAIHVFLNASHPPLLERIRAIRAASEQ